MVCEASAAGGKKNLPVVKECRKVKRWLNTVREAGKFQERKAPGRKKAGACIFDLMPEKAYSNIILRLLLLGSDGFIVLLSRIN